MRPLAPERMNTPTRAGVTQSMAIVRVWTRALAREAEDSAKGNAPRGGSAGANYGTANIPLPPRWERPGEGTSRKQSLKIASLPSLGLRLRRFAGLSHRDGRELWSLPTALT